MENYQSSIQSQKICLKKIFSLVSMVYCLMSITGCQSTGNTPRRVRNNSLTSMEAQWIRNGEPITFEGELWYPADGVEGFLDSEMRLMGEHKGVEFFIDKVDVRPFGRLYTKFTKNKFRFFVKRTSE